MARRGNGEPERLRLTGRADPGAAFSFRFVPFRKIKVRVFCYNKDDQSEKQEDDSMKYGVLWRKTTKNIGDDMQSYAESLWYPQVDYMIDIEDLDGFRSEDDEPVACIMSAWYMWHKWNWPPAGDIYPLWVGFHYNDAHRGRPRGMPSKWEYIDGPGRDYLLAHAPIGCRDPSTVEALRQRGVPAYYSGCITLTLPKRPLVTPERPYVCVVGVDKRVEAYIRRFYENSGVDIKVIAPTRPEPSGNLSWEVRKAQVEEMLDLYQNALAVYTFRLHCTLPTLALGTPVLLIRKSFRSDRFVPYQDYVHHCTNEAFLSGAYDDWMRSPPPNPDAYLPVRKALEETVSAFIEQAKCETRKASELVKTSFTPDELMRWQNRTMKLTLHNYFIEEHIDLRELIAARREIAKLQGELDKTRRKLNDYAALGKPGKLKKELSAYRALGSPQAAGAAVRRWRRLTGLWPVRLLKRVYRLFRK